MLELLSEKKNTIFDSQNTISLLSLGGPECRHLHKKATLWICNADLHTGNSCDLFKVTLTSFYSYLLPSIPSCPTNRKNILSYCPANRLLILIDKNGHFEVFLLHMSIFTEDVSYFHLWAHSANPGGILVYNLSKCGAGWGQASEDQWG